MRHGDKPVQYDVWTTLLSMAYIFFAAFIALAAMTFHKGSVVYKKRVRNEKAKKKKLIRASAGSMRSVEDLTTSLDAFRRELRLLFSDFRSFLSVRHVLSAILLGTGVVFMHFSGMAALRSEETAFILDPWMVMACFPLAWVGSFVILFFLFHLHGFAKRIIASVIIGVAVNGVHFFGYFAGSFYAVAPASEPFSGFLVVAEVASVAVSLMSSVARFMFMGLIAATSD